MTVMAIAQLSFTDIDAYRRYQAGFMNVFTRFSGRLLAADENPILIEGSVRPDKLVVMTFPDESRFHEWADSPEYRELSRDRMAGAIATVLLVRVIGE